jgi:trehalose 6-phosphate synthase/phosphatase
VLVQVAVPSRENVIDYARQRREVERLTGEVNGLFGSPGRVPIHYIYRSVPPEELGALYRLADVALVSPLRDGLNLVAKEYVACRTDGDGVLALSEFAGAASELGEALRINPWDIERTASQLDRALTMSADEQRERMEPMHRRVHENDVHHWVDRFMRSLNSTVDAVGSVPPRIESSVLGVTIGPRFAEAQAPLILLDYDGSLREFTDRYEDAVPTSEIRTVLTDLGSLPSVSVYINSGRDKDTLAEWFGDLPVSLIAEHGSWKREAGETEWRRLGPAPDLSWKSSVRPVLEEYARRAPGARVEEKSSSLVWHYRQVEAVHGDWQALELISVLENLVANAPVQILSGARVVEVRQQGLTKGRAYDILIEEKGPFDFVLATGDDRTDEDLFERLDDRSFSIHVGAGASGAQVSVNSAASVRRLLRALIEARREAAGVEPAGAAT